MKNISSMQVNSLESRWKVNVAQKQNRAYEDSYQMKNIGHYEYLAVFDGHGRPNKLDETHMGSFCRDELHNFLAKCLSKIDTNHSDQTCQAIQDACLECDQQGYNLGKKHGTTCTAILIDPIKELIYQFN